MNPVPLILLLFLMPTLSTLANSDSYRFRIPKTKTSDKQPLANMTLDTLRFMAGLYSRGSLVEMEDVDSDKQNWLKIERPSVAPEYTALFKEAGEQETYLDVLQLLKFKLKEDGALATRQLRHSSFILPDSNQRLQEVTDYKSWPSKIIALSQVKGTRRILYRSPKAQLKMSVAETVSPNGEIRETEIILKREDGSGDYDFYAYDKQGDLATTSLFHNKLGKETEGPVPHTCMACHYDGKNRVFQTKPLSFNIGN